MPFGEAGMQLLPIRISPLEEIETNYNSFALPNMADA
jgi:hypothetical protein